MCVCVCVCVCELTLFNFSSIVSASEDDLANSSSKCAANTSKEVMYYNTALQGQWQRWFWTHTNYTIQMYLTYATHVMKALPSLIVTRVPSFTKLMTSSGLLLSSSLTNKTNPSSPSKMEFSTTTEAILKI